MGERSTPTGAAAPLAGRERKPKDLCWLPAELVSRCHKSPSFNRSHVNRGPWEGSKDQSALSADLDESDSELTKTTCALFRALRSP